MDMIRFAKMKQWAAGAFACGLIAAGPAAAQLAQNSDAPVDITADELEVINAQCLATYSGGAEALQDTVRLRADVLKIYYKPNPSAKPGGTGQACGNQLDRMEAKITVSERRVALESARLAFQALTGMPATVPEQGQGNADDRPVAG